MSHSHGVNLPLASAVPALRVRAVLRGAGRPPAAGTSCPPSLMPLLLALRCGERGRGGNSGACDFIARCAEMLLVVGMGPRRPVAPLCNCLGAPSCAPLRGLAVLYFPKQKLLLPTYSASKESVQLSSPPPLLGSAAVARDAAPAQSTSWLWLPGSARLLGEDAAPTGG